ncbi:hypothetical protein [Streptomyces sp. BF23-19]|uniref:hypothetical protein n=1 Tax=unclassified Streptomyces TaxID=2593676 RepID=UPI0034E61C8C
MDGALADFGDLDVAAVRLSLAAGLGADAVLPRGRDSARQAKGVDAGVVTFKVSPEQLGKTAGEVLQRGVVESGLAFGEVVDDQVTDRPALQLIAVHELFDADLASPALEVAQVRRRVWREDLQVLEPEVEQ